MFNRYIHADLGTIIAQRCSRIFPRLSLGLSESAQALRFDVVQSVEVDRDGANTDHNVHILPGMGQCATLISPSRDCVCAIRD